MSHLLNAARAAMPVANPSRVRDAVLELAQRRDPKARVTGTYPLGSGTLFTLRPAQGDDEWLRGEIEARWPFVDVSVKVNDLDGEVDVGVLVPSRDAAWERAKQAARGGCVNLLLGILSKGALAASMVVFIVSLLQRLKYGRPD